MTLRSSPAMKRAAVENQAAGRIDSARRSERDKALEAAAQVRAAHIVAAPCQSEAEAERLLRCMAVEVHTRYAAMVGQHDADSLFARIARNGAKVPAPERDRAKAEAERVFAPANDRGGPVTVGQALAGALKAIPNEELQRLAREIEERQ